MACFTFVIMADPQAFRLMKKDGDPNSEKTNGEEWRRINKNLVSALNTITTTDDISFGIINGDMTEFGRRDSWRAVFDGYNKLKFPYYFGLGNHDYQNNVGDCFELNWLSYDGCALNSATAMLDQFERYNTELQYFTFDFNYGKGSLAYSWDYNGVHFVQLQNHPNYEVDLKASLFRTSSYFELIPSLTWLSKDLREAKLRGIKDIILNFHQCRDDFQSSLNNDYNARRHFHSIMLTYKPLAVFAGHYHTFRMNTHDNDPIYGNTTVYTTGASFDAKFHLVTYDNGKLTVKEMDGQTGQPVLLQTYTEESPVTIVGKLPGEEGKSGDIYMSPFIPKGKLWNLRQIYKSGNNVDADRQGHTYMRHWNEGNTFQMWAFEKADGDIWPEFNSFYIIRQLATGRVLDSNSAGEVYTKESTEDNYFQHWYPIKIDGGNLLLVNRATHCLLDGNGSELYTKPGYEITNQYKVWQLSNGLDRTQPENTRYFKALSDDSWLHELPNGNRSNEYWEYLSSHSLFSASPCIGW